MSIQSTSVTREAQIVAGGGFALAAVAIVLANTDLSAGDNGGNGPMIVGIAVAGAAALGFAIRLHAAQRIARTGMLLAVIAAVTAPIYWIGLPFVFGPGAVMLARRTSGRLATSAQVLGVLATLAAIAGVVADKL